MSITHDYDDATVQREIARLKLSGDLKPADRQIMAMVNAIRRDLLPSVGLQSSNVPVYVFSPQLLPMQVTATTKFTNDAPDHEKRPVLIGLNETALFMYPPVEIAATLAHEELHAALPYDADPTDGPFAGHGPVFASYARKMGLVGDPRSTDAGPAFKQWFNRTVAP